uniref:Uncharacterized protein n=1 Tax=Cajanus cajan TaxID=3821 RepID=A0A151UDX9_CAJCA
MIMRGHDTYSSLEETTTSSSDSEEEASECEEIVEENIFHTRCKVSNNACSLIVDNGSWCNCCSTRLVENWA